jgi:hypothetical protein
VCRTPRRALIFVETSSAESHLLATALASRGDKIAQDYDGSEIWVRLVSGLTVFGIRAALSGNHYDADLFPAVHSDHLFIDIYRPHRLSAAYPDGPAPPEFSEEEVRALASGFMFELNQALGIVLTEASLNTLIDYPDEDAVQAKIALAELRPLLTGPGMAELLRHFNERGKNDSA